MVVKRIEDFAKATKKSILSIEKEIGTRSTIQNAIDNDSNLGYKWVTKILEAYPDLRAEWLMRGKGEMLYSESEDLNFISEVHSRKDELMKYESFRELFTGSSEEEVFQIKGEIAQIKNILRKHLGETL